jgi:hypothetical protein
MRCNATTSQDGWETTTPENNRGTAMFKGWSGDRRDDHRWRRKGGNQKEDGKAAVNKSVYDERGRQQSWHQTTKQGRMQQPHGSQDDSILSAKLIRIAPETSSF